MVSVAKSHGKERLTVTEISARNNFTQALGQINDGCIALKESLAEIVEAPILDSVREDIETLGELLLPIGGANSRKQTK